MIISHEITSPSKCGGVKNVSTITPKYYAGIQNACLQCVERQGALQNLKHFSSLQKSYFSNIKELTHKIKTAPKVVLNFFQINLKIN